MKKRSYYHKFAGKDLSITDLLALDRTILANERNLLSFIRTFLSCFITGLGVIKFIPSYTILGISLLIAAIMALIIGIKRYKDMRAELTILEKIEFENSQN